LLYFAWIFASGGLSRAEKRRVGVILVLFVSSAIFWAGFEQAGSSFNLFAERFTERTWHFWDYDEIPAGWFQVVGPVFIITLAPVMAGLWVALARRKLDPSIPVKFGLGLCLLAVGFLIMVGASKVVQTGGKAAPTWLIMTYLIHTFGELCLSPVGLSSVTKLAPRRLVGQMMGVWFLATSLGNVIAGQMAAEVSGADRGAMITGYLKFTIWPAVAGVLLLLLAKPIRKWSGRTDEVAPH
jgi:POT family proton-dependent oligopeptide transporter